ncbi:MAG: ATP-binding cassette domain-containing protein [Cellvibrionaceae bacterium]|nr:ATP-binding cassette domain-containing protein [Cellvibrionaceae bacterium]
MKKHAVIAIEDLAFSWSASARSSPAAPDADTAGIDRVGAGPRPLLRIPHWQLAAGERLFLYGRSGTGKSTLLSIVSGILRAQHGTVSVLGQNLGALSQRQRDKYRAVNMGIIFQQFNLLPYLSVIDNIRLSQTFSGSEFSLERIHTLLTQLELPSTVFSQKAETLSVGQQQRVAVARALYHRPAIIIADEPTSALDAQTRDGFIELLLQQSRQYNSAVLFVSHDERLATHFDTRVDLQQLNAAGAIDVS